MNDTPGSIRLTCRCGWSKEFSTGQLGLTLPCPECDRDIFVTDNPAEFANRNVSKVDFALEEDESLDDLTPDLPEAPPQRIKGSKQGVRYQDKGIPKYAQYDAAQRGRQRRDFAKKKSSTGLVVMLLCVLLLTVGYVAYSVMNKEDALGDARHVATQLKKHLSNGNIGSSRELFATKSEFREFQEDLVAVGLESLMTVELVQLEEDFSDESFSKLNEYAVVYRVEVGDPPHRLKLTIGREGGGDWLITKCSLRQFTVGEMAN